MPNCPKCGAPLTLLSPDGTAWRCYNHGEANFHIDTPESRAAGPQAVSKAECRSTHSVGSASLRKAVSD